MNYLTLFVLLISNFSFGNCDFISKPIPNAFYEINCDGNIVSEKCGLIEDLCELELNKKLASYNIKYQGEKLVSVNMINKYDADLINCNINSTSLECKKKNNCKQLTNTKVSKVLDMVRNKIKEISIDNNCSSLLNLDSVKKVTDLSRYSCELNLEKQGINDLSSRFSKECFQLDYNESKSINCEIDSLLNLLNFEETEEIIINLFQMKTCNGSKDFYSKKVLIQENANFSKFLKHFFSNELSSCNQMKMTEKSIDQLICLKAEEFKFSFNASDKCVDGVGNTHAISSSLSNDRDKPIDSRNIAGQPEKESFTLPTEAPVVKTQETLQKIDKLIADNGGEMTPEVARKAGEIFNSGIYQPTKNFINSVEQAITGTSSSSGSSGRSSSRYKSTGGKSYEIGSKPSGRTVANITEEVPSAARASALNGKLAAGGSSGLGSDSSSQVKTAEGGREAISGNTQNDKKLVGNNFSASQGLSGGSGISGSVASTGVGHSGFSDGGGASRSVEQQQLPSLSPAEKSEISKVVQALKGAESAEDVRSIVTGEDNYQQVRRMIQELEKSKTAANSNPAANGRNPASTQVSSEVNEFEKTLEKFGIKVYGESGPGKAVYAPSLVKHVIVIKSNSVQFMNTIRSKK